MVSVSLLFWIRSSRPHTGYPSSRSRSMHRRTRPRPISRRSSCPGVCFIIPAVSRLKAKVVVEHT